MKVGDIIDAIEAVAPPSLQEGWDNTGLLVGYREADCRGVMLCVDVTPDIILEALEAGCDMIVSHHPLIFKGLKRLNGDGRVERSVELAVKRGVAVYCCHTSIDNAPGGVSRVMAKRLGVDGREVLSPQTGGGGNTGLGVVGCFSEPLTATDFVERVKRSFGSPVARCSRCPEGGITRVAMCGGSGSEFIADAVAAGAQAYITSDTRYHDFVDYGEKIFIVDIGHFESEECTKEIFYQIITEKFPNFAVCYSVIETNPISYL